MQILKRIQTSNYYNGSDWNFEKTEKYLIDFHNDIIEVGFFEHYNSGQYVKSVIELPVSFGCVMGCKFCASSVKTKCKIIDENEMYELFDLIYSEKHLYDKEVVLVTLTGSGDISYNFTNAINFLLKITNMYANIVTTVSSANWNVEMFQTLLSLKTIIRLRNIQLTFIHHDILKTNSVIANRVNGIAYEELWKMISRSDFFSFRINYICISGLNDTVEDFTEFVNKIKLIKEHVVVRISMLNETKVSVLNNLSASDKLVMDKFSNILNKYDIKNYMFYSLNNDNMSCGQLISE
ncbi:MAG: hypothetical protein R3Y65_03430 [Bacillota bacterium]